MIQIHLMLSFLKSNWFELLKLGWTKVIEGTWRTYQSANSSIRWCTISNHCQLCKSRNINFAIVYSWEAHQSNSQVISLCSYKECYSQFSKTMQLPKFLRTLMTQVRARMRNEKLFSQIKRNEKPWRFTSFTYLQT